MENTSWNKSFYMFCKCFTNLKYHSFVHSCDKVIRTMILRLNLVRAGSSAGLTAIVNQDMKKLRHYWYIHAFQQKQQQQQQKQFLMKIFETPRVFPFLASSKSSKLFSRFLLLKNTCLWSQNILMWVISGTWHFRVECLLTLKVTMLYFKLSSCEF